MSGTWRGRAGALGAACAAVCVLAGCGPAAPLEGAAGGPAAGAPGTLGTPGAPGAATSLATSLGTAGDSWALVPMSANPAFWQVFVRPTAATAWRLVTPPGVADNGGLVAAGSGGSLAIAVRPSQNLTFSPLAVSTDGGTRWSTGLIDAGVAASPGALAAAGSDMLALLGDGAVLASSDAGSTWRTLAAKGTEGVSTAGRKCGALGVTEVSFGISAGEMLAAGTCGTAGTGVFTYSGGGWRQVSLPVSGRVLRIIPGIVLVANGAQLYAARETGSGWVVSAPLSADGVAASGSLASGGAWVLLPGRRAATIGGRGGAGQPWRSLPLVPRGTAVLSAGPGGAVDALAVAGSKLTVWRLGASATVWSKVQTIGVPVQTGSSS